MKNHKNSMFKMINGEFNELSQSGHTLAITNTGQEDC